MGLKLNIGSKDTQLEGYTPVDRQFGQEACPLDYPDNSAEDIYASHILEHFPRVLVPEVLKEWTRVLAPGGRMRIAVPDFDYLVDGYKSGGLTTLIQPYMFGGQTDDNDVHYSAFNQGTLTADMHDAGLERIRPFEAEYQDCSRLDCSLNLVGYKPTTEDHEIPSVGAVLAAPRFGPTMHFNCHHKALHPLGIHTKIVEGCFWWQQLCEGMEQHLDAGKEFVLTMDYDSTFTSEDVRELYRLLKAYPEYDAVCATQSKRGGEKMLFASLPEDAEPTVATFIGPVTEVMTGHFGLTMFRGDALREQPRPWMTPIPNSEGKWSGDNIDVDIDFWRRWMAEGRKLGLANRVVIGHIQEMITWPGVDFKPVFQYMQDYLDSGPPPNVRV